MTRHNLTPDTVCYVAYLLFDLLQVNGELIFYVFLMHKGSECTCHRDPHMHKLQSVYVQKTTLTSSIMITERTFHQQCND